MDSFHSIVLLIAGCSFILILLIISYMMFQKKKTKYPPVLGDCPDYWISNEVTDTNGNINNVCLNERKLGTCDIYKSDDGFNFNKAEFIGSDGLCAKHMESKRCGFNWDGITNIEHCLNDI